MSTSIYWFRSDLRVMDSPALHHACTEAQTLAITDTMHLLPVYVLPPDDVNTTWGFARMSTLRRQYLIDALIALDQALRALGSRLIVLQGEVVPTLVALVQSTQAQSIVCEQIAAPEEQQEVEQLILRGIKVQEHWQSTMLDPQALPFEACAMPDVFTQFRQKIEAKGLRTRAPIGQPRRIPALPPHLSVESISIETLRQAVAHLGRKSSCFL
jgi:deoxyribodipyrimidine photo-lyase